MLGLYTSDKTTSFTSFSLETHPSVNLPSILPLLSSDCHLSYGVDVREIDAEWSDKLLQDAPLTVERIELSHNAAESAYEIIRIGLPYVVLVWNPFVKAFATEAGKEAYAATHRWLRHLLDKLQERKNPIVSISAYQDDCEVTFLIRGKDVKCNYAAHDALPTAAAQAAKLIANMKANSIPPDTLIYEFDSEAGRWFPSHAVLLDGRIVSDNSTLIAAEQLPSGLSLGLMKEKL